MKTRKTITAIVLAVIMLFIGGCTSGGVVQKETRIRASTGESWTVMLYMCGSTLEEEKGLAGEVLNSLAYDLPENVNVVVETGGSRKWSVGDVYSDYLQDFIVQKNGIRLINQSGKTDMGKAQTLSDFMNRSAELYPAEHYMTIIWDHGGGPLGGVAFDSNYEFDSLSINELKTALSSFDEKLDIIGFDAGLMSNYETASAVSLYADYIVASEDVMTLKGWDYKRLFEFISDNPDADPAEIGKNICDGVADGAEKSEEYSISMAVTDLTKQSELISQFGTLAGDMAEDTENIAALRGIKSAMNSLEMLGGNSHWEGYSNLTDMGGLAKAAENMTGESARRIISILEGSVVYKVMSDYHSGLSGMSIYYPSNRNGSEIEKYGDICGDSRYLEFLEKTVIDTPIENRMYNFEDTAAWQQYSPLAAENTVEAAAEPNGSFIMNAAHIELIKSADVKFYVYNEKESQYVYIYSDNDVKFDSAAGGYTYELTGKIPQMNGNPVSMYLVSSGEKYDIYSIPVMRAGKPENIRFSKSKGDNGKYKYLGIWSGVGKSTGMCSRSSEKLDTGDVITPLYEVYGGSGNKFIEGSEIRIGFGELKITEKKMSDNNYMVSYTAVDLYGIETDSKAMSLSVSGGNVQAAAY